MTKYIITVNSDKDKESMRQYVKGFFDKDFVDIESKKETRTTRQSAALHLWFTQLSQALNEKHFSVKMILDAGVEVEWTSILIKEILWRKLQIAMFNKKSTTSLFKSGEIDEIFDTINRVIIERTNGEVIPPEFPSDEFFREEYK